jgi:hypothetical protein
VMVKMAVLRSCTLPRSIICKASIPHGSECWCVRVLGCAAACFRLAVHTGWFCSKCQSTTDGATIYRVMAVDRL